MLSLTDKEKLGLYLLLKQNEEKLDFTLNNIKTKLEEWLYTKLDIFEMNNLDNVYEKLKEGDVL